MNANRRMGQTWAGHAALFLAFSAGVTALLLWLADAFTPKAPAQSVRLAASENLEPNSHVTPVRRIRLPLVETAVGTIRPVHETAIGARLLARVVEVNMRAGQVVQAGDVLVHLDDADLRARRRQAEALLKGAQAARVQAEVDAKRSANLWKSKVVSRQEHEQAETALKLSDAELSRVQESVHEIQAMLDWATIRSPISGIVIDKKVDVGDMVTPGQMLATLFDPKRMQLVASVRESLAHRLKVGQSIDVRVGLARQCTGVIREIVPEAESSSRAFQVKVTGPCPEGVYSGAFGRILIPLDDEQVLVIPRQAVQSVGQLDLVRVANRGAVSRRAVRLGRTIGQDVEVLSGLGEGEQVETPRTTAATRGGDHG